MARRKKPEGETPEQADSRRRLEAIADAATRSEKVSWDRKMNNMVTLLSKIRPIEDQILDLMSQKMPLMDEVAELRREMVKDCVHPYTHLVVRADDSVECKFCSKRFNPVQHDRAEA